MNNLKSIIEIPEQGVAVIEIDKFYKIKHQSQQLQYFVNDLAPEKCYLTSFNGDWWVCHTKEDLDEDFKNACKRMNEDTEWCKKRINGLYKGLSNISFLKIIKLFFLIRKSKGFMTERVIIDFFNLK